MIGLISLSFFFFITSLFHCQLYIAIRNLCNIRLVLLCVIACSLFILWFSYNPSLGLMLLNASILLICVWKLFIAVKRNIIVFIICSQLRFKHEYYAFIEFIEMATKWFPYYYHSYIYTIHYNFILLMKLTFTRLLIKFILKLSCAIQIKKILKRWFIYSSPQFCFVLSPYFTKLDILP